VHPEYVEATRKTAHMLEKLGHRVEEARPQIDGLALAQSYLAMYYGEVRADIEELQTILQRKAGMGDVEIGTWTLGLLGTVTSAPAFIQAKRLWNIAAREMGRFLTPYDLYLTPTMAGPPIRVGALKPKPLEEAALTLLCTLKLGRLLKATGLIDKIALENLAQTPFTLLANFTGQPAMSVPLHQDADGLPIGLHFMARTGDEATLFRLAAQLEQAYPWFERRPRPMG
jgi:amidase